MVMIADRPTALAGDTARQTVIRVVDRPSQAAAFATMQASAIERDQEGVLQRSCPSSALAKHPKTRATITPFRRRPDF